MHETIVVNIQGVGICERIGVCGDRMYFLSGAQPVQYLTNKWYGAAQQTA